MIRIGISLIVTCLCSYIHADTKTALPTNTVFSEIKRVSVLPVICESKERKEKIQKVIEQKLRLFGKVQPDNANNFGAGTSVLNISIGPIAPISSAPSNTHASVTVISMQLLAGAELTSNKAYAVFGLIWEKTSYINSSPEKFDAQLNEAITIMLEELQNKYQAASSQPSFFMSTI